MGNKHKDKNKDQGDSAATEGALGDSITNPWDAPHTSKDLSWEREARETALAKQLVEAIAREMAKAHTYYQALLNERGTAGIPTSLKMTSGALGFKVMDPLDWTKDRSIYQRWQMWSEKARHVLDAMEGDSENQLLAVEELHFAKQGSMDSGEFHAHVVKIAKGCKFPCTKAEERAIKNTTFLGMNSTQTRDKAINFDE